MLFSGDIGNADGIGHGCFFAFVDGVGDLSDAVTGFDDGIGENTDDEFDGAGGVIVGWDWEVNEIWIIVGID